MVSYQKPYDAEECAATAYDDENVFAFLSAENYGNFMNNAFQNQFSNDETKFSQDDAVHDILYGQIPDTKRPPQNTAPKNTNVPYYGDLNLVNYYHTHMSSNMRQPQAKVIEQNGPFYDSPMNLPNMFPQNPSPYELQDPYQSMNSARSSGPLVDPIPTSSHCLPTYNKAKNLQNNAFYHFTKDHSSDPPSIFSDGIYTKGFEILRENSEQKFQSLPCLEPNIKGSDSLNGFHTAKDDPVSSYNDQPSNSTISPTAVEKSGQGQTSQSVLFTKEFGLPNLNHRPNYQPMENFDHEPPSCRNPSVPNFFNSNIPVQESRHDLEIPDLPSNTKPNQTAEISLGLKNGNCNSQIQYFEAPKRNILLPKRGNCDKSLNPLKNCSKESNPFECSLKHKPLTDIDDLKLTAIKRPKPDYVKILPAGIPSKQQIPTVNITIHQVPNTYKIPPNYHMDTTIPNTQNNPPKTNNNTGHANKTPKKVKNSKKAVKIPVSIKARNAKFLCAEKDLRCRTVRELLETCETIQGNTGMRAKIGPFVNISAVPAGYFYESTPQTPLLPMSCLNNTNNNPENMKNKVTETLQLQIPPEFQKMFNLPTQRIYEKNFPRANITPDNSVKVYQPVANTWKILNCAGDNKKAFKPKHFDFSFLQIRNFKYFCTESDEKRTSKLKLIFSKKKLVYEFQLKETFDSSGGCMKHLAMIEIKFGSIIGMWGHENELRFEVNEAPHMYVGTRFCSKDQHFGPHQNAQYDRSRTTDLTLGEIYQVPFHYIQLRSVCANKILSYMSHFSPQFERMLRFPLIEDMHKVLPQIRVTPPEMVPARANKFLLPKTSLTLNKQEVPSFVIPNGWHPEVTNFRQQFKNDIGAFRPCPHRIPFL